MLGDITEQPVDAIVNAANSRLLAGGGVDGAIHRAAGPELQQACTQLKGCPTGQVKITPAFNLPCRYVIHAVGPVWQGGHQREAEQLASCYQQSLMLAQAEGVNSIAFPAISCGSYAYPAEQAAEIALNSIREMLQKEGYQNLQVKICCFDQGVYRHYLEALSSLS